MSSLKFHPDWFGQSDAERIFDSSSLLIPEGGSGLPAPLIHDVSEPALRLREVTFAAKRLVDMVHCSDLDWDDAMHRLVWRGQPEPGGLSGRPDGADRQAKLRQAHHQGRIAIVHDATARRVTITWTNTECGGPITGAAIAPPGLGGVVLGHHPAPQFAPFTLPRRPADPSRAWPQGDRVDIAGLRSPAFDTAVERFFAASPGAYGLLVASPGQILFERFGAGGAADRRTPSWSMNKSLTGTLIGRMIQLGWLDGVDIPARAPLWRDPRGIHASITLDDLLRMRSGLGMPTLNGDGVCGLGFENSAVYYDGADAFEAAQRSIVATRPGAVFRYVNSGLNVLGAVIRDRIESRGLPYHQTVYELLADRLGMASYMASADIAGNLIASGAAFGTLRDFAKIGVLYVDDGMWDGERLLPKGWVDYALAATHAGTSYAATFWTNSDRRFPALPPDAAWLSGASDQRVFILRGARRVVAVSNETDVKMDLAALNELLAAVLDLA